jgi:4-hydroxy-tetrahydrodipicolinate synthase
MDVTVKDLAGRLIPAVPVPFRKAGGVHEAALKSYVDWMAGQPIGGVAVWAHTGRGLHLGDELRKQVIGAWRRVIPADRLLIAAAGAAPSAQTADLVIAEASAMARQAADLGADAILVHPPSALRDHPDRDAVIRDYHSRIAEAGLPLVLFYLYEAAGGISYSPGLLAELLARPEVLGIKIATLDSVMTFQDIARLVRTGAPEKLTITGEDRFLGYSLMCGATAALIGMAAACTGLQAELLLSYQNGHTDRFLSLNAAVDDLAQHTFRAPLEGYIQRMLWCLVHEQVIPDEAAHDPWGPRVDPSERDQLSQCLNRLKPVDGIFDF